MSGIKRGLLDASALDGLRGTKTRQRAFTLLARTYGQVRRVLLFMRWESGDADELTWPPTSAAGR